MACTRLDGVTSGKSGSRVSSIRIDGPAIAHAQVCRYRLQRSLLERRPLARRSSPVKGQVAFGFEDTTIDFDMDRHGQHGGAERDLELGFADSWRATARQMTA